MKKLIISTKGEQTVEKEMTFEEVLTKFSKQIRRSIINFIGFENFQKNEEELMQQGNIMCWLAFKTYDEKHCFSTHLEWQLKGKLQQLVKAKKAKKRSSEDFSFVNINDATSFDSSKTYEEYIPDESISFTQEYEDSEMMKYLLSQIKEEEKDLLALNLGYITVTELAEKTGTSKANISYKNKRFKAKLVKFLTIYNQI